MCKRGSPTAGWFVYTCMFLCYRYVTDCLLAGFPEEEINKTVLQVKSEFYLPYDLYWLIMRFWFSGHMRSKPFLNNVDTIKS